MGVGFSRLDRLCGWTRMSEWMQELSKRETEMGMQKSAVSSCVFVCGQMRVRITIRTTTLKALFNNTIVKTSRKFEV